MKLNIMELKLDDNQRVRVRRFALALFTYGMAILALFFITRLGMGTLSPIKWAIIIGLCLFGNGVFLMLFITGRNLDFPDRH